MSAPRRRLVLVALGLLWRAAAGAPGAWDEDPEVQRRLAAGEVAVQVAGEVDAAQPRGRARAAVRIRAAPERIWAIMTDCRQTPLFVPGLKSCRRIDGAADGSSEDVEYEVHYSWLLPTVRYVLREDYQRPRRIDFRRIRGDLRDEEGSWQLKPSPDGASTLVEYEVYVDPGFWIPRFLVVRWLRRDLPAALAGLKERAERAQDTH